MVFFMGEFDGLYMTTYLNLLSSCFSLDFNKSCPLTFKILSTADFKVFFQDTFLLLGSL